MGPTPVVVGRQGEHAEDPAEPVVDGASRQERAMSAVVLDQEEPHQEAGCRQSQQQTGRIAVMLEALQHERPEEDERHRRHEQLDDASLRFGRAIARERLHPAVLFGRNLLDLRERIAIGR
jgi:hypothetical protein